ncbi:ubiquitin-specific protease ubp1 [Paecilomyces lecythidis]
MNARLERYNTHVLKQLNSDSNNRYDVFLDRIQNSPAIAYTVATLVFLYFTLNYLNVLPFSISHGLWSALVYLVPSRVVFALDKSARSGSATTGSDAMTLSSFQAKSEAMQRVLGLDSNTLYSFFPRARSLSIGNVLLGGKDHIPPGLGNWDNSCFQNSMIQGMASLKLLKEFLDRNLEELAERTSLSTHNALKDIIERLNDPSNYGQKLWIPPDLKSMSSWQQQDAQEYFSKIVDQIDREILQASRGRTRNFGLKVAGPQEHVIGISSPSQDTQGQGQVHQASEQASSLRNPMEGLLAQRVGCMRCGWTEGLSLIPFNCLTVPLGRNWEYDIRDCLDEYMTLEPIEGVECAKCTLLRTREQLLHLLGQIADETELANGSSSPKLSDALKSSAEARLKAVEEALEDEDFSEKTLQKKCHIPSKSRVSTTKSRQAVIARAPKCLVIHVNRSLFDENTGALRKNYAEVRFPKTLDLDEWCLGTRDAIKGEDVPEQWVTDPQESMLPRPGATVEVLDRQYELRAVVTHYGRHENGHYICYRKYPTETFPASVPETVLQADGEKERPERWFRLSDDDVQMVSERTVFSQGGVFMLFYEAVEAPASNPSLSSAVELNEKEQDLATPRNDDSASARSSASIPDQEESSSNGSGSMDMGTSIESRTSTNSSSPSPSERHAPLSSSPSTTKMANGEAVDEISHSTPSPVSAS